jgi:hypothetical protein
MSRLRQLVHVLWLFVCRWVWRVARLRIAGRRLVRALRSPDETTRTVAGIFLVQEGRRSVPLLHHALKRGESVASVLRVLGDIGDRESEPAIARFATDRDAEVAQAARDALQNLHVNSPNSRET